MKKTTFLISICFLVTGCFQSAMSPMVMLGPATGAYQGKIMSSSLSTVVNYSVKQQTGKFPYEHIIKKEKQKLINKAEFLEKEIKEKTDLLKLKTAQIPKDIRALENKKDYLVKVPGNLLSYQNLKIKTGKSYLSEVSKKTFQIQPRYSFKEKK
tara:strand:+ start:240 stop:701 length:462 start_codon:yes stop_codon:yes gene_type:complete